MKTLWKRRFKAHSGSIRKDVANGDVSSSHRTSRVAEKGSARSRGDTARDVKDWIEAVRFYRDHLEHYSRDAAIWIQLGHALKESGQIKEARLAYERAVSIEPTSADAHLQLGHSLKLQGLLMEALLSYGASKAIDDLSGNASVEIESLGGTDAYDAAFESCRQRIATQALEEDAQFKAKNGRDVATVEELLSQHHLTVDVKNVFDPEFYSYSQQLGPDALADGGFKALVHFCEVGIERLASVSDTLNFDPIFYADTYSIFTMSDVDAYRRWLNFGSSHGQAPNLAFWLTRQEDVQLSNVNGIDLAFHCAANSYLAGRSTTQVISHLLGGGLIDDRFAVPVNAVNLPVFIEASRRAARRGSADLATRFLESILAFSPDHTAALSDYADRLIDVGRYLAAAQIYGRLIETGRATRWTYHLLGRCYQSLHLPEKALEIAERGLVAFPQHDVMRRDRYEMLAALYKRCEGIYWTSVRLGRVKEGQDAFAAYSAAALTFVAGEALPHRNIRSVALFGNLDLPQCKLYRIDQKVEQLLHAGFDVKVYDASTETDLIVGDIARFDAIIFYRIALFPHVLPVFAAARLTGTVTFYEIDDLIFDGNAYPDSFESYGGQITPDEYLSLSMGPPLFAAAMALCDYGIASTPTLATHMRSYIPTGQVFVHRNALGEDHMRHAGYNRLVRDGQPVTIFYGSGTRAHKADFQDLIEPALIDVAQRHGDRVRILLVGWLPISEALRKAAPDLISIEPSFDVHRFWALLKEVDINIAALKPTLAVDCKSEIKWIEAALFGIPSIVSRTKTFAEVISHGIDGFLCDNVEDWKCMLDRLIVNRALREAVGNAARQAVMKDYGLSAMSSNLSGIMNVVSGPQLLKSRYKILFVNVFYTPQKIGGATRVLHDNIVRLQQIYGDAFECEVFTVVDGKPTDYVVEGYAVDGVRVTSVSRSSEGESCTTDLRMEEIFRRFIKTSRPDLIHYHCIQRLTVSVINVALELNIPYIITAHDAWWISSNQFVIDANGREEVYDYRDLVGTLVRCGHSSLERAQALLPALFGARHVLGVSQPFSTLYERCGVPRVATVANGVSPLAPEPRIPSSDGRVRLGFIGGMQRHKGFPLLKGALMSDKYKNLSLVVVDHSQSSGSSRYEQWGTVPVQFIGKFDPDKITELYALIDVLVAPSVWPESFGLVTREARLCGCWIVASDRGDIGGDVADGIDGHIIDVADSRGLASILRQIDQEPERYRQSPVSKRRLRTSNDQVDDLAAIYFDIAGQPQAH